MAEAVSGDVDDRLDALVHAAIQQLRDGCLDLPTARQFLCSLWAACETDAEPPPLGNPAEPPPLGNPAEIRLLQTAWDLVVTPLIGPCQQTYQKHERDRSGGHGIRRGPGALDTRNTGQQTQRIQGIRDRRIKALGTQGTRDTKDQGHNALGLQGTRDTVDQGHRRPGNQGHKGPGAQRTRGTEDQKHKGHREHRRPGTQETSVGR
ncbi:hypothetical protein ACOMHN_050462 [Nucella lapillus]